MLQQILYVQHQKATVGLVDAARADQGKVGDQSAHFRFALHTAQQIDGCWVVFNNNGRTFKLAAVYKQVDLVAVQHGLGRGAAVHITEGATAVPEQKGIGIFKNIFAQFRKIGIKPLDLTGLEHALLNGCKVRGQHLIHGIALKAALVVLKAFFRLVELAHKARHGLHKVVALALEAQAQICVQLVEFFFAQALALHQGVQGKAAAFVHIKVKTLAYGYRIHFAQQAHAGVLKVVYQLGAALYKGAGLKTAGQLNAYELNKFLKVLLELFTHASGQGKKVRPVRICKIMHIYQVVRRGQLFCLRAKIAQQHVAAAKIGLARQVDVVALVFDLQGKIKCLHGPWLKGILASVARQRNVLARIPGNTGRINSGVQTRCRQRSDSWHRGSLLVIKFFQNGAAASGKKFFGKFKPHLTGL